jgi:hypothetical protein
MGALHHQPRTLQRRGVAVSARSGVRLGNTDPSTQLVCRSCQQWNTLATARCSEHHACRWKHHANHSSGEQRGGDEGVDLSRDASLGAQDGVEPRAVARNLAHATLRVRQKRHCAIRCPRLPRPIAVSQLDGWIRRPHQRLVKSRFGVCLCRLHAWNKHRGKCGERGNEVLPSIAIRFEAGLPHPSTLGAREFLR